MWGRPESTALGLDKGLDVLTSTPARFVSRASSISGHLRALASRSGEKCGLGVPREQSGNSSLWPTAATHTLWSTLLYCGVEDSRELICTVLDLIIPPTTFSSAKNLFDKVRSEGLNYWLSPYVINHFSAITPLSIY